MNYKFYLEYQMKQYTLMILTAAAAYGITLYFGHGKPIILTIERTAAFVSGSLTFIFFGAYMTARNNPFNK